MRSPIQIRPKLRYLSPLQPKIKSLQTAWANCRKCACGTAKTPVVHVRGVLPADVLFVGEAPGEVESASGFPFVGPSGALLQHLIEHAQKIQRFSYAIINVVGCWPKTDDITRPPTEVEIDACAPRTQAWIDLAEPSGIVLLGKSAQDGAKRLTLPNVPTTALYHPAYILRKGGANAKAYSQWLSKFLDFLAKLAPQCRIENGVATLKG